MVYISVELPLLAAELKLYWWPPEMSAFLTDCRGLIGNCTFDIHGPYVHLHPFLSWPKKSVIHFCRWEVLVLCEESAGGTAAGCSTDATTAK